MKPWFIVDWTNKIMFDSISFRSFEDAEAWLSDVLEENYDDNRQEYYIVRRPA